MKFSTREEIDAPAEYVFKAITNFDAIEKLGQGRGIIIAEKNTDIPLPKWKIKAPFRGKMRLIEMNVSQLEAPEILIIDSVSGGLKMQFAITVTQLPNKRSRIIISNEVVPTTLSARILIQSVKFAKKSLDKRFSKKIASACDFIESQYKAQQS